jgi:hypothetical protein
LTDYNSTRPESPSDMTDWKSGIPAAAAAASAIAD